MKLKLSAVALTALIASGCTTVTRGTNDTLVVETTPAGASVETSNGYSCNSTPCAIRMPRRSEFVATITKEGYETIQVQVSHQISNAGAAGMAGNVLVGGVIGAAIDAGSGAMNDLTPNPIVVELVPLADAGAATTVLEGAPADVQSDME